MGSKVAGKFDYVVARPKTAGTSLLKILDSWRVCAFFWLPPTSSIVSLTMLA